MTYRWIWTIDCQKHGFHKDSHKLSDVQLEVKHHVKLTNCSQIGTCDIKRIPAPNDTEY